MAENSPTFLYVENDAQSRHVVSVLLTEIMGYTNLVMFEGSDRFLEHMHQLETLPDVIFLDIQMQPHDGYEMLSMLQADPAFKAIPVIAMTASVMTSEIDSLRKAGFSGLIGKPINRALFPKLVHQILDGESVWFVS